MKIKEKIMTMAKELGPIDLSSMSNKEEFFLSQYYDSC